MPRQKNSIQNSNPHATLAGGAATHAGIDFQNRVTSWIAVRILAGQNTSPPWELAPATVLEQLRCEAGEHVDDILVITSIGGRVFIQAKHRLTLAATADSDLASCVDQFIRQYLTDGSVLADSTNRVLNSEMDRFVIATSQNSPESIRVVLPSLLKKLRELLPGQTSDNAILSERERQSFRVIKNHADRLWQYHTSSTPSDDDILCFLSFVHIQTLEVDDGGHDELGAKDALRSSILRNPVQADVAWSILCQKHADFATRHSGADRATLQRILLKAGIELQARESYRESIDPYNVNTAPSCYDDTLARAGIVAEQITQTQKFADYQQMKAKNTQLRQKHDLQLFSTYLAQAQITRTADNLYTDAQAWQGMNAGLLEGFKKWMLKEGYAIGSINIRLATIRKYCELASTSGVLSAQDLALIKLVKGYRYSEGHNTDRERGDQGLKTRVGTKKAAPTPVSTRQALRLKDETTRTSQPRTRAHDQLLEARDALLMCLLIEHVLRVSEVVGLDANSINLEPGTITVYQQKTYMRDTYELMPRTREAAEGYLPLIDHDGPLFTSYQGKRITRYGIFERVRLLGKQVGIENLSPHDLRHFWTVDAFRNGNGIDLIQRYGGWNSPAMPLHYAKVVGVYNKGLKISQ